MLRFHIFLAAWSLTGALIVGYVGWGLISDVKRKVVERRRQRVLDVLSIVLFESDEDAARIHERARAMPRRALLNVIQSLAVDLNGQARSRLQQLVRALGLERFIRRRATSRRWRMRTQAAQLQYLVEHPDFDRRALLVDRHHIVRARAVESLTAQHGRQHIDLLIELLEDPSIAVRLAVQQKLLEVGTAAVPAMLDVLNGDNEDRIKVVLDVAANLADPRLVDSLTHHGGSDDPAVRATAARALGSGSGPGAARVLERLCADSDPNVRVAAIDGLARMEAQTSAGFVGQRLSDRSWQVRRAAGLALDGLGPPGRLILRARLADPDPYARDMARQILDAAAARSGLSLVPPLDNPLAGLDEWDVDLTADHDLAGRLPTEHGELLTAAVSGDATGTEPAAGTAASPVPATGSSELAPNLADFFGTGEIHDSMLESLLGPAPEPIDDPEVRS